VVVHPPVPGIPGPVRDGRDADCLCVGDGMSRGGEA
jgi:hypothetical protein